MVGEEGCACTGAGECIGDLACISDLCVDDSGNGDGDGDGDGDGGGDGDGDGGGDGDGDGDGGGDGDGDGDGGGDGDGDGDGVGDGDGDGDGVGDGDGDGECDEETNFLSDNFEAGLFGWVTEHPGAAEAVVTGGDLRITPNEETEWWDTSSGILLYKVVCGGNFRVTAPVAVFDGTGQDNPPSGDTRLAGLMIHANHPARDYVLVLVGQNPEGAAAVARQNTDAGVSTMASNPYASNSATLRLCRVGFTIGAYAMIDGQWQLQEEFFREDLGGEVRVGLTAYSGNAIADLVAYVEAIDFEEIGGFADCVAD